jgi:pantoate--beta-alanine ligase
LQEARDLVEAGERRASVVLQRVKSRLEAVPGAVLDYVAVVDADTLQPVDRLRKEVLVAVAVSFGATRLIDNTLIQADEAPPEGGSPP